MYHRQRCRYEVRTRRGARCVIVSESWRRRFCLLSTFQFSPNAAKIVKSSCINKDQRRWRGKWPLIIGLQPIFAWVKIVQLRQRLIFEIIHYCSELKKKKKATKKKIVSVQLRVEMFVRDGDELDPFFTASVSAAAAPNETEWDGRELLSEKKQKKNDNIQICSNTRVLAFHGFKSTPPPPPPTMSHFYSTILPR